METVGLGLYFEDLPVGRQFRTIGRTVTEADIVNFAGVSGDYFYAHTDETALEGSIFEKRVAHGYFVISAAAPFLNSCCRLRFHVCW